jgi:hypothetical protein
MVSQKTVETKVTGVITNGGVIGVGGVGGGDGTNTVTTRGNGSLPTGKKPTTQEK